jgi:hypothetical protein
MDTNDLKERIAETLVEGILRRARYRVALAGRQSRVRNLLRIESDGFMPDLLAWKQTEGARVQAPQLIPIDVRYRADVQSALRQEEPRLASAALQWSSIYFVFVTEHPEAGRSCFQVVDLRQCHPEVPWHTVDLHEVVELDIYWHTVEEYEGLVKMIFPVLSGSARAGVNARKPGHRLPGRITAVRVSR